MTPACNEHALPISEDGEMDNMERFYLEVPSLERKEEAIEYINEFTKFGSHVNGAGGLNYHLADYEEWLRMTEAHNLVTPNEIRVPAREYFLVRESDNRIIGMINIRLNLNERLKKRGGHIGYSIRPTERGKGYNKVNLYLGLKVCNRYGINPVLMDADLSNPASWKTMESLGGVRIREFLGDPEDGVQVAYSIDTKKALSEHAELEERVVPFSLETERLVLREMSMEDYDALYDVWADSDNMKHYPYTFDETRVREWILRNRERYQQYGFGLWAVCLKKTGEVIGDCGLTLQNIDGELLPEIGYHIRRDQQNKGYAKEAATAVRDRAFRHTSYPALYSYCKYTNEASYKTAEAIGMTFLREYPDEVNGTTHVSVIRREEVTACTDREWILSEDAYGIYASCMYKPTYEGYVETMTELLKSPSVETYVYRTENYIAGMLVIEGKNGNVLVDGLKQTGIETDSNRAHAEILGIAVDLGCRHFGIGRKMLKHVTESGRFDSLYAQTDDDGVEFYRSCGFAVSSEVKQYPNGEVTRYHCLWKGNQS